MKKPGLVRSGDRLDPAEGFEFLRAHRAMHSITTMSRVLGVSSGDFYAWLSGPRRGARRPMPRCSRRSARSTGGRAGRTVSPDSCRVSGAGHPRPWQAGRAPHAGRRLGGRVRAIARALGHPRRRSHVSCAATRPRVAGGSTIGRRSRSGRRSCRPAAPRGRSWVEGSASGVCPGR